MGAQAWPTTIEEVKQLSYGSIAAASFVLWIAYLIGLVVYRLYFSPLAKFPGPKLAAVTKWYEAYYEVVKRGKFTFHFNELHDKYGPIVRITPYEVHIKDTAFFDTLYLKPKTDRYAWMNGRFGNDTSIFTTHDAGLHRIRRGAMSPMFSKKAVTRFEPFIRQSVSELCGRLAKYKDEDKVVPMHKVWDAYATDMITQYSFGFNYGHMESEGFQKSFHDAFMAVSEFGHIALQMPWITPAMNSLPDSLVSTINPPLERLLQLQRDLRDIIHKLTVERNKGDKLPEQPTIFHEILNADIPEYEKSNVRLAHEAQTVIGAGLLTTAWTLSNATFYIANSPKIQDTLRAELKEAFPDLNAPDALTCGKLEKLPYLRGCLKEAMRFAHGLSGRNPRLLSTDLQYEKWNIPAGTPISMTLGDIHFDESIYPEPYDFRPERWLGDPKAPDGSPLERYFVGFGKGPRACLGLNLAWQELYIALGSAFRFFSFEICGSDRDDVLLAHDFFVPSPKSDSRGVNVKITSVNPQLHVE